VGVPPSNSARKHPAGLITVMGVPAQTSARSLAFRIAAIPSTVSDPPSSYDCTLQKTVRAGPVLGVVGNFRTITVSLVGPETQGPALVSIDWELCKTS